MTTTSPRRTQSAASRKFGYCVAAACNAVLMYLINRWPGWTEIPFLTGDFQQVLGLMNLSLAVGVGVNLMFALADPPWLKALGSLATTGIGLAVIVRLLEVYPFDVNGWDWLVRLLLIVGAVGSVIGFLAQLAALRRRRR